MAGCPDPGRGGGDAAESGGETAEEAQRQGTPVDKKEYAPGITCDGEQTLSENIADPSSIACLTQIVSQQEQQDYETLYRTVGSTWAMATTRERLALFRSDIHPPDALRSQLPLQTCDEFYETFGITEGDGMWIPPEERVSTW